MNEKQRALTNEWAQRGDVADRTYLLLRNSMPFLLLWLTVAIIGVWAMSGQKYPMTSISAYYYTDAQPVFVGVLIALGVLLIVIQGRTPWEDTLMNTAGALAPFVALFPTPVKESAECTRPYCTAEVLKAADLSEGIPNNHDLIDFNIWAVAPIWALLVGYLLYVASRAQRKASPGSGELSATRFGAGASLFCGVLAILLWSLNEETKEFFYDWAHLASAGLMVTLLLISIVCFARWAVPERWAIAPEGHRSFFELWPVRRLIRNRFGVYFAVAIVLIVACVVIVLVKPTDWNHKVIVIEAAALLPFAFYWVMQGIALRKHDAHRSEPIPASQPPEDARHDDGEAKQPEAKNARADEDSGASPPTGDVAVAPGAQLTN